MPEVRRRGVRYSYREQNPDGIHKVVLLHPQLSSSGFWDGFLPGLDESFRVIAFDLRGCGDTDRKTKGCTIHGMADDLRACLAAIGVQRCSVIGANGGASVAMSLAARYPSLVFKQVLFNPMPVSIDHAADRAVADELANLVWQESLVADFLQRQLWSDADDDLLPALTAAAMTADRMCAAALARSLVQTNLIDMLPQTTARTLVATGADAGASRESGGAIVAGAIPNSATIQIAGSGSLPVLQAGVDALDASLILLNSWDLTGG